MYLLNNFFHFWFTVNQTNCNDICNGTGYCEKFAITTYELSIWNNLNWCLLAISCLLGILDYFHLGIFQSFRNELDLKFDTNLENEPINSVINSSKTLITGIKIFENGDLSNETIKMNRRRSLPNNFRI